MLGTEIRLTLITRKLTSIDGLPRWLCGKEAACQSRRHRRRELDSGVGKIPGRRKWQPTPIFLPGELHGQRSLVGCRPWIHKESDTTERLIHTPSANSNEDSLKTARTHTVLEHLISKRPYQSLYKGKKNA